MITLFIVSNYGPNWFGIKSKPACTDGPQHIYQAIQRIKCLPAEVTNIVKPFMSRNAYFAHPEHVLLAMLCDICKKKREKAVHRILNIREYQQCSQIRRFTVPQINFDAQEWDDIINWDSVQVTEPPLTIQLTNEDLLKIKDVPLAFTYPNHTQAVERCIKLVSDASQSVYGFDSRDGFIRARVESRCLMPGLDTKKQFF